MIQRRKPIARSTKRIPQHRKKARRGPFRCKEYLAFLREEGRCVACVVEYAGGITELQQETRAKIFGKPNGGCDPAHGPVAGMSAKSD